MKILAKELDVSELNSLLNSSAVFSFCGLSPPSPAAFAKALFSALSLFPSLNLFISSGEFLIFSSILLTKLPISILIVCSWGRPTGYFSPFGLCFSKETSCPWKGKLLNIKALTPAESFCCNSNIFSLVITISSFFCSSSLSSPLLSISSSLALSPDFFLCDIESSLWSFSNSSSLKLWNPVFCSTKTVLIYPNLLTSNNTSFFSLYLIISFFEFKFTLFISLWNFFWNTSVNLNTYPIKLLSYFIGIICNNICFLGDFSINCSKISSRLLWLSFLGYIISGKTHVTSLGSPS